MYYCIVYTILYKGGDDLDDRDRELCSRPAAKGQYSVNQLGT